MTILRRIGGGLVFVLAIVGLIVSLAGIVGLWVGRYYVEATTVSVVDLADSYLGMASQTITNLDGRVAEVEDRLNTLAAGVSTLRDEDSEARQRLERTIQEDLRPRLDQLVNSARALRTGLASFDQRSGQLNRVPFVQLPEVGNQLATLDQALAETATRSAQLRDDLASLDGTRILAATQELNQRIGATRATLQATNARITSIAATLPGTRTSLLYWGTLGTVGLTAALVLFTAGQISLAAHAWGWMTGRKGRAATGTAPRAATGL